MFETATDTPAVYTPTQLNRLARDLIEGAFGAITLEAEISGLTKAASGHYYFTLKDERAQIRGAMFKMAAARLQFAPRNGLKVQVRGKVSIYEATGSYQLIADRMTLAGEGDLNAAFEALKAKLQAEGLFDSANKKTLPAMPHRIAVVTSPTGAAVRDVLSVLERRFPLASVDIVPVLVQGDQAAPQIVRALQALDRAGIHDVVLLTRGGGSLEDLWAFNEEPVVRMVAELNLPIVAAVGHETDFSLAEFAADLRAPTPSAAAEMMVPERSDLGRRLASMQQRLDSQMDRQWQSRSQQLDRLQLRLRALHPNLRLTQFGMAFDTLRQRMTRSVTNRLQSEQMHLTGLGRALNAVNPLQTLERGYAVVRDTQGHVLLSAHSAQVGMDLRINLRSGELRAKVTDVTAEDTP